MCLLKVYLCLEKQNLKLITIYIPREVLQEDLERCMRIPMSDNVRSLNLSNCCAIVIYEVLRQLDYLDLLKTEPHKSENYIIDGIESRD